MKRKNISTLVSQKGNKKKKKMCMIVEHVKKGKEIPLSH